MRRIEARGLQVRRRPGPIPDGAGALGGTFATWVGVAAVPIATVVNVGLLLVALRVLTASEISWRQLRVGAVVAGIGWQIVQMLGTYLVTQLKGAPFTDRVRLTPADTRAYTAYAQSERHKGFEVVDVGFETPAEPGAKDDADQER